MSTPLTTLKRLSIQARQALLREGITTLEEAVAQTDAELLAIKGVAASSLQRLRDWQARKPERPRAAREGDVYTLDDPAGKAREDRLFQLYTLELAQGMEPSRARSAAEHKLAAFEGLE